VRLQVAEDRLAAEVVLVVDVGVDQQRLVLLLPRPPAQLQAGPGELKGADSLASRQGFLVGLGQGLGVVDVDHHQPPGRQLDERAVSVPDVQEMGNHGFHYLASPISGSAG
jgi:hypothetical protein